ncbi:MAG: hypothetical protein RL634_1168 [Bacteroidota bacterium]|jgi:histidinol-phosphate aminotransferase
MFNLDSIVRKNIKALVPYASARDEFSGEASVFLDANENALGSPLMKWYNRYPDPMQWKVKEKISFIKKIPKENIFLGNGSDEPIDNLLRCFCEPHQDEIIVMPPTYGMYEVYANIHGAHINYVPMTAEYQIDLEALENAIHPNTKIIWICTPNNPTGNSIYRQSIEMILNNFDGLVVVDEAYINFSRQQSFLSDLSEYPNLIVLQTLSKAWGLAGLRIGMAFASKEIISYMNKVKAPYNISVPIQELALKALDEVGQVNDMIKEIVELREKLVVDLRTVEHVIKINPSDTNFLLVQFKESKRLYDYLLQQGIVVRDRSNVKFCEGSLRITVGNAKENEALLNAIKSFKS